MKEQHYNMILTIFNLGGRNTFNERDELTRLENCIVSYNPNRSFKIIDTALNRNLFVDIPTYRLAHQILRTAKETEILFF